MKLSIRWKLTLGLLALTMLFVGGYIILAKETFEDDKISFVFDMQQTQIDGVTMDLRRALEKSAIDLKTVAFLVSLGEPGRAQDTIDAFARDGHLVALGIWSAKNPAPLLQRETVPGVLARVPVSKLETAQPVDDVGSLSEEYFGLSTWLSDRHQDWLSARGVFKLEPFLSEPAEGQRFFLTEGERLVAQKGATPLSAETARALARAMGGEGATITRMIAVDGEPALVSRGALVAGKFRAWAVTPKAQALAALQILYRKSVVFAGFSFFTALLLALFLSYTLTKNISRLTVIARQIGKGDFSDKPQLRTGDEIGVLARTFGTMMDEIQGLLKVAAEKGRMETELKTARLVQENLFPQQKDLQVGSLRVTGLYETSSECGGDWWYRYQRGDELYVMIADATGHGTPAALITSAARAVCSYAQLHDLKLHEIAALLDSAIHQTSAGKLGMTAYLMRINVDTGVGAALNASHEDPVVLTPSGAGFSADFLTSAPGSTLGENKAAWSESYFVLEPGQKLILRTDGLTAMAEQSGKTLGDKRLLKLVEKSAALKRGPELALGLYDAFLEAGGHQPLVDDVTLVIVENTRQRKV